MCRIIMLQKLNQSTGWRDETVYLFARYCCLFIIGIIGLQSKRNSRADSAFPTTDSTVFDWRE